MQRFLCLLLPALAVASKANTVHPIQKVTAQIRQLDVKAVELGKTEAISFEKYEHFMEKEKESLSKAIASYKSAIEEGKLERKSLMANKEALVDKQEAIEDRLKNLKAANAAADEERADAVALFSTKLKDLNQTIDALREGRASLEAAREDAGRNQSGGLSFLHAASTVAKSLINQHASLLEAASSNDQAMLLELAAASDIDLATASDSLTGAAPTKPPVKSHTDSVIDLLKKMQHSYEDQLHKTDMEALLAKGDFEIAHNSRVDTINLTEDSKNKGEASLAQVTSDIAAAESDLKEAKKDLETNSESLKDTKTELKMTADEFKERNYMRNKEREAFSYALKILAKVSGLRTPAVSLVQLPSGPKKTGVAKKKIHAINLLHEAAHLAKSKELQRLVSELENGAEPMAKVAKKVDLSIFGQMSKLKDDQLADDKQRMWCEQEINKTEIEKKFKGDELQELKDKIEVAEAKIATLEEGIEKATESVKDAKKDMHEEAMLRADAKNENSITEKDAVYSQEALKEAIKEIKAYYADAQSFIQVHSVLHAKARKEAPSPGWSKADAAYEGAAKGDGPPGEFLLNLLQSTQTEYATMEATVKAEEASQADQHNNKMKDWKMIIAEAETEIDLKTQDRFRLVEKLKGFTESSRLTDRQETSLANYLQDVTKDCYGGNSTFKTRAAERAAEMESLNTSRAVLADAFKANNTGNSTSDSTSNSTSLLRATHSHTGHSAKRRSRAAFLAPSP